jgi:hypothetical protein
MEKANRIRELKHTASRLLSNSDLFRDDVDLIRDMMSYIFYINFRVKPPDLSQYGKRTSGIIDAVNFDRISTTDLIEFIPDIISDKEEFNNSPPEIDDFITDKEVFEDYFEDSLLLESPSPEVYIKTVDAIMLELCKMLSTDRIKGERTSWTFGRLWGVICERIILVRCGSRVRTEILRRIAQYHTMRFDAVMPHLGYNIQNYGESYMKRDDFSREDLTILIGTIEKYRSSYNGHWDGYLRQMDIFNRILIEYLNRYRLSDYADEGPEYLFPDIKYNISGELK